MERQKNAMTDPRLFPDAEPGAPSSFPVRWAGWSVRSPNRVARATAKLWYDARNQIARELGISSLGEVEVVRVED